MGQGERVKLAMRFAAMFSPSGNGRTDVVAGAATPFALGDANGSGATSHRRALFAVFALLAVTCLHLAVFASRSEAAVEASRSYVPGSFLGSLGTEPGQFSEQPGQIAAEPGSGNLLVADPGNGRVQVFATDSTGAPSFLTTLGAGTLVTPAGIAVDPGTGAIYVSDSGAGKVFRFTSDGAATPTYAVDATFTSPTEVGSFDSAIAIDPTSHDLLIADTGSQEVRRFDVGDGHMIKAFNGSTSSGGQFTALRSVAVAPSGRIYVVDEPYPSAIHFEFGGRVEQFDATGNPLGQLQGVDQEGAVGADPTSGAIVVGWHNNFDARPPRIAQFEGLDFPVSSVDIPAEGASASLTFSGPLRLYVLMEMVGGFLGAPGIQQFRAAEIPAAELGPTGPIGDTTAHVTGSVAPGTLSGNGTARFEYSFDGSNWKQSAEQGGIAGPGETGVSADLTDLRPNSSYSLRLRIVNDDFSTVSPVGSFTTPKVAPIVEIESLSDVTAGSAVLYGTVNPAGQQTTYHFEYGATSSYGNRAPAGAEDVAGGGYVTRAVSHGISGLEPGTTYHYRLVATNASGTNATADATFTTRPASALARGYEQVTPVDKGGAVVSTYGYYQARADGNAVIYQTKNSMDRPDVAGAPIESRHAARRTATGWDLRALDLPMDPGLPGSLTAISTIAVSADISYALVASNQALTPGAIEGAGSLYRRNIETGSLELVATGFDPLILLGLSGTKEFYYGGSADFSRIYLLADLPLTADATPGYAGIYEWTAAQGLRLASPAGSATLTGDSRLEWPVQNLVAADGSAYFDSHFGATEGIFRSTDGPPEHIPTPGTAATRVLDVSPDGRIIAFSSGNEVYRYDTATGTPELIFNTPSANGLGFMGMSADGSTFVDSGPTASVLTVWHNGAASTVGTTNGGNGFYMRGLFISQNGRYVAFTASGLVDQPYDNSGCPFATADDFAAANRCIEVYLYDAEEKELTCVSCPADGSPSIGHAHLSTIEFELSAKGGTRLNNGAVVFDTPAKLVGADRNGTRDVYIYRDGEAHLVSPGNAPFNAYIGDASADFSDVFFITRQPLVGQDDDNQYDVYDARLGGGIAAQSPDDTQVSPCIGADCRAPVPAAGIPPTAASETVATPPRKKAKHRKGKAHQRKHKKHRKSKAKRRAAADARPSNPNLGK
jgi:hypothetical protein